VCESIFIISDKVKETANQVFFVLYLPLDRFRNKDLSEEELCLLMGEFVHAAQTGDHKAQGWPNTAYGTTKVTNIPICPWLHPKLEKKPAYISRKRTRHVRIQ